MLAAQGAIQAATGYVPCVFRAPANKHSPLLVREARALGMNTVQWSVDSRDWTGHTARASWARVRALSHPGRRGAVPRRRPARRQDSGRATARDPLAARPWLSLRDGAGTAVADASLRLSDRGKRDARAARGRARAGADRARPGPGDRGRGRLRHLGVPPACARRLRRAGGPAPDLRPPARQVPVGADGRRAGPGPAPGHGRQHRARPAAPPARWDRFSLSFAGGGRLALRDRRRLGRALLEPDFSHVGPDAGEVSRPQFRARVGRGPHRSRPACWTSRRSRASATCWPTRSCGRPGSPRRGRPAGWTTPSWTSCAGSRAR